MDRIGARKIGMTKHTINIQDGFLFQALKVAQPMFVELVNGRSLEGRLKRFDRFALVVEVGGREVLIYKHAIATVSGPVATAGGA
jgi:host factor-I protein